MKISGFTFVKNATKLYYPIQASIRSILPLVDEFVVALGDCDADDHTQAAIEAIGSEKIRILHTVWDLGRYPRGTENAHQTDLAKAACTGDWLFYLQADEVVHEKYLPVIEQRCRELLHDTQVEALLFDYEHFWGDYNHVVRGHGWYGKEIRIVRNDPDIHSWRSAQSFRRIPAFDGISYRQKAGTFKLHAAPAHATIYHYGWVRPPQLLQRKRQALGGIHHGAAAAAAAQAAEPPEFDYGPLNRYPRFEGTHPAVMADMREAFDWADKLRDGGPWPRRPEPMPQERLKKRLQTWLEDKLLGGRRLFTSHNYHLVRR